MTKFRWGLPILAMVVWISLPAWAGDKEEAKQLFDAGLKLMKLDDFAAAAANFERSTSLFPTQNSLFNLANCYQALRRYGDALTTLDRLNSNFLLKPEIKSEAARQEAEIRSLAARLILRVAPGDAELTVDGKDVGTGSTRGPVVLPPGDHIIDAVRPGYRSQRLTVQLFSGKEQVESVALEAEPSQPSGVAEVPVAPSPSASGSARDSAFTVTPIEGPRTQGSALRIVAWSAAGAALAAGVVAATFWRIADGHNSDYQRYNTGDPTLLAQRDAAKTDTQRADKVAIGCGVAAAALAVTAGITYWLGRGSTSTANAGATVSLSPVGLLVTY
jgi:hypothetical protein